MMKWILVLAALLLSLVIFNKAEASSAITAVYFYPNDQVSSNYPIEIIMSDVQSWYGEQVENTFNFTFEEIQGQRNTEYYLNSIWGNVLRELEYWCGTGVHVIIVHPSIGFTGGGACPDGEGVAMIEEDVFITSPFYNFNGVVAHELGHAFALPHSDCTSVMWCWWDYPNVGLTTSEIQTLQGSRYFGSSDPDPTPKPCEPRFNKHDKRIGKCK